METPIEDLKALVKGFPKVPGVYLMKNRADKILYVGKAKNLKARVGSYFQQNNSSHSGKTLILVKQISSVEYIVTQTETEAFLLEASLIKRHRPKYNIRLKDDKAYPYIRISAQDPFPRVYLCRRVVRDGSLYFGPYSNGHLVRRIIDFLNKTFSLRDCTDTYMKSRKRPCMTHQIGRCPAPCVGLVSAQEYGREVARANQFLRGNNRKVSAILTKEMKRAASEERFEAAAQLRDSLQAIESILEQQSVVTSSMDVDQDVINYFGDERGTVVETLHIRKGRVIGSRPHFLPQLNTQSDHEEIREWLTSFVNQYYYDNVVPDEVLLPFDIGRDLTLLLSKVLKERAAHPKRSIRVYFPTDHEGHQLLELCAANANNHFKSQMEKVEGRLRGLEEIQRKLHLESLPVRIECFDISHFQGKDTVASRVVFEDGVPAKDHYRRYKIRSTEGKPDDYLSMKEVLGRRFRSYTEPVQGDDQEKEMKPNLVVVDGGKGQLAVAVEIFKELGIDQLIPLVALAKSKTKSSFEDELVETSDERFYLPGRKDPVIFRQGSHAYQILITLRNEAHRFAISYHRTLRDKIG